MDLSTSSTSTFFSVGRLARSVVVKRGWSRLVLLIGDWAVKVPRLTEFRAGLRANRNECAWTRLEKAPFWREPVWASFLGGAVVIMRRGEPVGERDLESLLLDELDLPYVVDWKASNFVRFPDGTKLIDYGEMRPRRED